MKKLMILLVISMLVIGMAVYCSASDRWLYLCSDNEASWYLDTTTVYVTGSTSDRTIECWVRAIVNKDNSYFNSSYSIQYSVDGTTISNLKMKSKKTFIYDGNGNETDRIDGNDNWGSAEPGSTLDRVIRAIIQTVEKI